jgi:hypothetical protein
MLDGSLAGVVVVGLSTEVPGRDFSGTILGCLSVCRTKVSAVR